MRENDRDRKEKRFKARNDVEWPEGTTTALKTSNAL